ncbi:MAG: ATP-binding protein, partial [Candidatus Methanomethylophilaceae archaeon]|nr:ATP-binding protein [Candidatus Methanomethylophilaceae archaeon]
MTDENVPERTDKKNPFDTQKMDRTTMKLYWVTLGISVLMAVVGIVFENILDIAVAAGVALLVVITMRHDYKFIHIPPMFIILMMIGIVLSTISGVFFDAGFAGIVQKIILGVILGLMGFICAYLALGKIPGFSDEKPGLISLEAFTFGVAMYAIFCMIIRYVNESLSLTLNYSELFDNMVYVTIGAFLISLLFYMDKSSVFKHTVFNFMYNNKETLGVKEENERLEIENMISLGESDTLEFKSTLRTNLKTGEKDKRMEKAVLKTITAFLNTDGGTLLIGVTDDGEILGIDEKSFDNRDKMNLHMTNLLSSQIGDDFLPYIRFKLVEFDEKAVMRVTCKRSHTPVFLKDNKTEIYYV